MDIVCYKTKKMVMIEGRVNMISEEERKRQK